MIKNKKDYFRKIFRKTLFFSPVQLVIWTIIQWKIVEKLFNYENDYGALLVRSFFIYILVFFSMYLIVGFLESVIDIKNNKLIEFFFKPSIMLFCAVVMFILSFFIFVKSGSRSLELFFFYFISPYFIILFISSYVLTYLLLLVGIFSGNFLAELNCKE
ncbi:MAG: hypothetical protein US30_C0011G0024 [Candidatus Moranbacteria bacterium GW2011_GWF2_36_839]|nr:MAG: hypothetical protein US27_C0011G0021 [Candidatus Moranbacteria bacterium GW2011_GWF1_36_78]KKQ16793.1 MAG: hypothetical protein US30_C0011G0024 [Candidatus Moranbacteria bacterium GW2011_GWF2_36_839]HAT73598.1 hypothetical protein [Candidatus Moranbacteria bacterium]HBY10591.1 hypothetical protein [Candidatus Moranbacteria bacterium]